MGNLLSQRAYAFALAVLTVSLAAPFAGSVAVPAQASSIQAHKYFPPGASPAYAQAATRFPVFAQPAAKGDALPSSSAYSGGISRRIAGSTQPFSTWAVLRGNQLCITVNARSGPAAGGPAACNSVSRLTQPGQFLVLTASTGNGTTPQIIAGLVPGGISSVTISYTNGSTAAVPVNDNGFAVDTGGLTLRTLRLGSVADDFISLATMSPSLAPAYTGEFCYGVLLNDGNTCRSNTESNIRRAIGHGSDYTFVSISGDGLSKWGSCRSDGCTADTGYLSRDVTGDGLIENSGPCNCTGYYYGWLYS
jgi:hypothetical protein